MSLYSLKHFSNIFKKSYKLFIIIFLILISLFTLSNQTFFKDKIDQKYTVIYDYTFFYSWTTNSINKIKFDKINEKYDLPFAGLKDFHENYFELIYNSNINDLKIKDKKSHLYNIAKAFHFDTPNFTYPNRKLTLVWNNIEEADFYLNDLHERAKGDIFNILSVIYQSRFERNIENFKSVLISYPPELIAKELIKKFELKNQDELNKYVNNFIIQLKTKQKVTDRELFTNILPLFTIENISNKDSFNSMFGDSSYFLIYYYLGTNYSSIITANDQSVFDMMDFKDFINNIDTFLPKFEAVYSETNKNYIYFIELFLSFLISFLIIFTKHIKKKSY